MKTNEPHSHIENIEEMNKSHCHIESIERNNMLRNFHFKNYVFLCANVVVKKTMCSYVTMW